MSEPQAGESAKPIQLEYAPDPWGRRWRKRFVRALLAITIVLVGWIGYSHRDEISLRVRRWYWARQCLAHVTPPGTELLIYDNATGVVASNPDYMIDADPTMFSPIQMQRQTAMRLPRPPAGYMPREWREFARLDPRTAFFTPLPMRDPTPMNFLGERRTPGGKRRLVAIAGESVNAVSVLDEISYLVLPVPSLFEAVGPTSRVATTFQWSGQFRQTSLKPAIADANDPTHLTIDFTIMPYTYGQPRRQGVIDIYLHDDDTLDFRIRDPATTQGL